MYDLIKKFLFFALAIILISSVSNGQDSKKMDQDGVKMNMGSTKVTMEPVGVKVQDGILYGKEIDPAASVIEFSDLINNAKDNNGKIVVVKGVISEVCQTMGCWIVMSDGTKNVRAKTLHKFFLPKDLAGQTAIVSGTFNIAEITEDEAREYAEESKNPAIKSESIKGPQKVYEIDATGIKIMNSVPAPNSISTPDEK